jgi:hypothetical protein
LPLPKVLPVREWLGTEDDEEINAIILPAIAGTRDQWGRLAAGAGVDTCDALV